MWSNLRSRRFLTVTTDSVLLIPDAIPGTESLAVRVANCGPTVVSIQGLGIRVRGTGSALVVPAEWCRCPLPVPLDPDACWCAPLVPIRKILEELNATFQMRFWWRNCWPLSAVVAVHPHGHCTDAFLLPNRGSARLRKTPPHDGWQPPLWS